MTRPRRYSRSRCSICARADSAIVEQSLALGLSCASVAARFQCSEDALQRHRSKHMSVAHSAALLAELRRKPAEITLENFSRLEADRILAEVVDCRVRCRALRDLALAQGAGGFALALQAEASIRSALSLEMELLAPLLGATLAKDISPPKIERIERVLVDVAGGKEIDLDAVEPVPAPSPSPPLPAPAPSPPRPEPARNVVRLGRPTALWGTQSSSTKDR